MNDEPMPAWAAQMEARMMQRLNDQYEALLENLNDQYEALLEKVNALQRDFENTKGFLIDDALTIGRRVSGVERRIDRLERGGK